ncbi:MAG: hypothetical protein C0498_04520 [Anaerolinea sp.]|nr:hypothetical protein [Anaerolinea sp.]
MTGSIVLDASVAVPLVHREPESDRWRLVAAGWLRENRRIIVPDHFWLEVSNTLIRRHRYGGGAVLEALHLLDEVVAETAVLGRPTLLLAIDRAERFGLSTYDVTYLALAESLDAELATMDRALERAAGPRLASAERPSHRLSEEWEPYDSSPRVTWPDYSGAASYLSSLRAELRRPGANRIAEVRGSTAPA